MNISEYFPTIQGEGKYIGTPSLFLRTTGCNLRCAWKNEDGTTTLCDTPYTSHTPERGSKYSVEEILSLAKKHKLDNIVITGGEPLIQKDIEEVTRELIRNNYQVTIETNGTIYKNLIGAFMSISPKLGNSNALNSNVHLKNNYFLENIEKYMLRNEFQLKYVVNNQKDMNEILDINRKIKVHPSRVYLMPQGISTEQFNNKNEWLIEQCKKYNFRFSPRLHIILWGNIRGV